MEPYRKFIGNTGGNKIEELMNDHETNSSNHIFRAAMIASVDSQIDLLTGLHSAGLLK
jgi:hypothetical protein